MDFIYNKVFLEHDPGEYHPENVLRLAPLNLDETDVASGEQFLSLVHSEDYIAKVRNACMTGKTLYEDTPVSEGSWQAAIHAVGAAVQASRHNDFAIVRPPGHHAYRSKAHGLCMFNNLAIAAKKLVSDGKKVMILDFDGHHGDGTYEEFKRSDRALYMSLHQDDMFPWTGDADEIGEGDGAGYSINIPLPADTGDDVYLQAFGLFMQTAEQFKPDTIAVSAGFDAHHSNHMVLNMKLSNNTYYEIGRRLSKYNVFAVLEGGYDPESLLHGICNFKDGINGKEPSFIENTTRTPEPAYASAQETIERLCRNLSPYWQL